MAYRKIEKYDQAFGEVLGIQRTDKINLMLKRLENEGISEKSICFSIWKTQDKLIAYLRDNRFLSVLENEIRKYSWTRNDPRWINYNQRKIEEKQAELMRKHADAVVSDEKAMAQYESTISQKRTKGGKMKLDGYVYFVQGSCGGPIKIGYSKEPEERLRGLQTSHPDTLRLIAVIPGNEGIEKALHREFDDCHLRGEWFRPSPKISRRIDELKTMLAQLKPNNEFARTV